MSESTAERMETNNMENADTATNELPAIKIKEEIVDTNADENAVEMEENAANNEKADTPNADDNANGCNNTNINTDTDGNGDANTHSDANAPTNDTNGAATEGTTEVNKMDTEQMEEDQPDSAEKQVWENLRLLRLREIENEVSCAGIFGMTCSIVRTFFGQICIKTPVDSVILLPGLIYTSKRKINTRK